MADAAMRGILIAVVNASGRIFIAAKIALRCLREFTLDAAIAGLEENAPPKNGGAICLKRRFIQRYTARQLG